MFRRLIPFLILLMTGAVGLQPATAAPASPGISGQQARDMGNDCEALVDALIAHDAAASRRHYRDLKRGLDALHAAAGSSERRTRELFTAYSWMRLVDLDLRAGSWTGAAIAANQMSGEIIRFTEYPALGLRDAAWMDYLGRDVMLLAMEDMQDNAQTIDLRRNEFAATWQRVREALLRDFRNKTLVLQGDRLAEAMQQADTSDALIAQGRDAHRLVAAMQQALADKPG